MLNRQLDQTLPPQGITETRLSDWLEALERSGAPEARSYWLILARLMEMALICAGHYADHGAFTLAGDLLVNPRKIHVYRRGALTPITKTRHGRLTDQLGMAGMGQRERSHEAAMNSLVHTVSPALIPSLFQRLETSERIRSWYLDHARMRMEKIADTIGFLSAWSISGIEDIQVRLEGAPATEKALFESRRCRFDATLFYWFGHELRLAVYNTTYQTGFLLRQ
ncbi:MAG: hypothetical protein ABIL58_13865 [Pseudomonadota bacterium]